MNKRNRATPKEKIAIAICDGQPLFRLGLRLFLEQKGNFLVIAETANSEDLMKALTHLHPEVILIDIFLSEVGNFEVLKRLKIQFPNTKIVLIVPRNVNPLRLVSAIQAGASSFVLRDSQPELVVKAIQSVMKDLPWIPRELTEIIIKVINSTAVNEEALAFLTEKERQVLIMIAKGLTNKEIARQLGLSLQTVKTHVSRILQKLKVRTRREAARYAIALLKSSFDGKRLKVLSRD